MALEDLATIVTAGRRSGIIACLFGSPKSFVLRALNTFRKQSENLEDSRRTAKATFESRRVPRRPVLVSPRAISKGNTKR